MRGTVKIKKRPVLYIFLSLKLQYHRALKTNKTKQKQEEEEKEEQQQQQKEVKRNAEKKRCLWKMIG